MINLYHVYWNTTLNSCNLKKVLMAFNLSPLVSVEEEAWYESCPFAHRLFLDPQFF